MASTTKQRDFGLDVVRSTAIGLVILAHASVFYDKFNVFTFGVLPACGFIGVELFFGLSGYLIGMILLEGRNSVSIFYLKRLMKILPPYFLVLGAIFLVRGD